MAEVARSALLQQLMTDGNRVRSLMGSDPRVDEVQETLFKWRAILNKFTFTMNTKATSKDPGQKPRNVHINLRTRCFPGYKKPRNTWQI